MRGIKSIGTQTVTEQDEQNLLNKRRGNQGTWVSHKKIKRRLRRKRNRRRPGTYTDALGKCLVFGYIQKCIFLGVSANVTLTVSRLNEFRGYKTATTVQMVCGR